MIIQRLTFLLPTFILSATSLFSQTDYFQQKTNYHIDVYLNDSLHELQGNLNLIYTNNSPDTLNFIYFHIWPNAYSNKNTAFAKQQLKIGSKAFQFAKTEQFGFMDGLSFTVNDKKTNYTDHPTHCDIIKLHLPLPLKNGDSCIIKTPFHVKIPDSFSRLGHTKKGYQISQWYPKPAVYDLHGWHEMPYLDMGEFYSEFGSFDVSITLPKNYVVGATGNLQTIKERRWIEELSRSGVNSDSIPSPFSCNLKTIRFTEDNIHDFAWFASKRYLVATDRVILPGTTDTVETMALYYPDSKLWHEATSYINDALLFYSEKYMNYPYQTCTAVEGALKAGGAMEYPTITVVGDANTPYVLELMIMHEVGHNWFYGILGFNERDYPWMDEGLNSFSERRYMKKKYPHLSAADVFGLNPRLARFLNVDDISYHEVPERAYQLLALKNADQASALHSTLYNPINYGISVYLKNQAINNHLMLWLGEDRYDAIMHDFTQKWAFKHPQANDYLEHLKVHVPDLGSWYFDDLMNSTRHLDYKVGKIQNNEVEIKNKGEIAAPLHLSIRGDVDTSFWQDGFSGSIKIQTGTNISSISLYDSMCIAEINPFNNIKGKNAEPVKLSLFQLVNKVGQKQVGILPMLAWNNYNGMMGGFVLHNPLFLANRLEYTLAPFYGFKNGDLAGFGNIRLNFRPTSIPYLRKWSIEAQGQRFAYESSFGNNYDKFRMGIQFKFAPKDKRRDIQSSAYFGIQHSTKLEDILNNIESPGFSNFFISSLNVRSKKTLRDISASLKVIGDKRFSKSDVNISYKLEPLRKLILSAEYYGAFMIHKSSNLSPIYFPNINNGNGPNDFLYENLYLGRFENPLKTNSVLSQQISTSPGTFVSYLPFANSPNWSSSLKFQAAFPKVPGFFYANFGMYDAMHEEVWNINGKTIQPGYLISEGGWGLGIGPVKIYLPIWGGYMDGFAENYWQKIRFSIRLNQLLDIRKIADQML